MGGRSPPLLAGYETPLLDGNALAATEHRLDDCPPHLWQGFAKMPIVELADFLQDLAAKVSLKRFLKAPPQKKKNKKKPSPQYDPKHPHVSTAKLLSGD